MTDLEMTKTQAIATARRMYAGDWGIKEIRDYLAGRGHDMTWETIKGWADPEWAERRREQQRLSGRRWWREKHGTEGFRVFDEDARKRLAGRLEDGPGTGMSVDLMHVLRVEDGLSYTAIAKVATRLFAHPLSEGQVRSVLYERGVAKNPNKVRQAASNFGQERAA